MENQSSNSVTFMQNMSQKTEDIGKNVELAFGGMRRFFSIGTGYFIMLYYIAPLMNEVFLIANWLTVAYLILGGAVIGIILYILFNIIIKLLLYAFS